MALRIRILAAAAFLVIVTALVAQKPVLAPQSPYPGNLSSIVVADLDADSRPEIIGLDYSSSSVVVLKNLGDGKYGPPVYYPVTGQLNGVAVGDFNNDGKLDVAVAIGAYNAPDGKVAILRGNGDTTLEKPVYHTVSIPANSIAVVDFNNDNRPDIAVIGNTGDNATNTVAILTNTGSSFIEHSFTAPTYYTANGFGPDADYVSNLVEGDFNGDGRIDLAYIDSCTQCDPSEQTLYILANLASGWKSFTPTGGSGSLSMTAADIDGDGITDLVIPYEGCHTPCVGVAVLYMDKNFNVANSQALDVLNDGYGPIPQQVVVGDFNNDGITDIAGYTPGGDDQNDNPISPGIAMWTGLGKRTFNNLKYYDQPNPPAQTAGLYTGAGFLTGYPARDLVVPWGNDVQVWRNSTTESHDPCPYPTVGGIHACEPASKNPSGTIHFLASARSNVQPLDRIELWIDGKKEFQVFADRMLFELPLADGEHRASFFEIGASGLNIEKQFKFTVGK